MKAQVDAQDVVIVDAVRSAFGRGGKGSLVATRMDEVGGQVLRALLERQPGLDPAEIEDVAVGNVMGLGELAGMTSNALSRIADLPPEVSTVTVNRQCGSSMQALHMITRGLMSGAGEVGIAMGVERMGRGIGAPEGDSPLTRTHARVKALSETQKRADPHHQDYYSVPFEPYLLNAPANPSMPQTAQNVAEAWSLEREALDAFAVHSHHKTAEAYQAGHYASQIVPLEIQLPCFDDEGQLDLSQTGDKVRFERDECVRPNSDVASLAALNPLGFIVSYGERALRITAGNSCPTNDGAAAVLLMTAKRAQQLGLKPLAKIKSMAVAGVKPQLMGIGTIPASAKALQRAGLKASDIGLAEVNEAFASQSLATIHDLGLDENVVNVNGGSIAIGHPLGASGARLFVGLTHEMRRRGNVRYGLATMCIGVGMGIATVIESLD